MYLDYYGLRESAFNVVTDPRFLYYSESHCEAMSHVLYGVRERKGIIVVAGEAGTGKTTLIRATLNMLQRTRVLTSVILNPMLGSAEDLLDAVLRGFSVSGYKTNPLEMMGILEQFAIQQSRHHRIPVILLDEAQALKDPVLECVRLLSNLEDQGAKLLQIVLSAQPEINERLSDHAFRA
jgi:general secretion pathway protein A